MGGDKCDWSENISVMIHKGKSPKKGKTSANGIAKYCKGMEGISSILFAEDPHFLIQDDHFIIGS